MIKLQGTNPDIVDLDVRALSRQLMEHHMGCLERAIQDCLDRGETISHIQYNYDGSYKIILK